jgi:hypothetical protein
MLFKIQMIDKRYNSGAKTKFSPNPLNSSEGEAYERTIANSAYVGLFITSAVQRLGAGVAQSDWSTGVRSQAQARNFSSYSVSRPAPRPSQPRIQYEPGALSRG